MEPNGLFVQRRKRVKACASPQCRDNLSQPWAELSQLVARLGEPSAIGEPLGSRSRGRAVLARLLITLQERWMSDDCPRRSHDLGSTSRASQAIGLVRREWCRRDTVSFTTTESRAW